MNVNNKKKYRVKMRLVEEDILNNYEDISYLNPNYRRNNISRVVDGNEICAVLTKNIYRYNSN